MNGLRLRPPLTGPRTRLTAVLAAALAVSVAVVAAQPEGLHGRGLATAVALLGAALTPDLSPGFLATVAEAALLTLSYAVASMTVALVIGLPGALAVSGLLARRPAGGRVTVLLARSGFAGLRAFHELVWALLLVVLLGLTPMAGVLAIGVPYGAIIAKVIGERLQEVPTEPLDALRSAGARPAQVVAYGAAPLIAADAVAYLSYRFECAVRSAAVLSFVGLGGIGLQIQVALADLAYGRVWTLVAALVVLVVGVDRLGSRARRRWVT